MSITNSGAGTNLKVGRKAHVQRKMPEKFFSAMPFHYFSSTNTISRFGECFGDG